ncbi:hypothetical protein Golax_007441 [Gossypium laxum]|uniref:Uncharacterized protein n=1 Tax=Gossypium laxum TaxID=34288 RepID=A0A7J9A745_9ROSI|nr:hypothetical protein [Gossypium laxum]
MVSSPLKLADFQGWRL